MDEDLVERVRGVFADRDDVEEKRMFGGLTFMASGHVCCGVSKTDVMFRVGEAAASAALGEPGVRSMDITGRPLNGIVFVDPKAIEDGETLESWVARGLEFVRTLPPR